LIASRKTDLENFLGNSRKFMSLASGTVFAKEELLREPEAKPA
jgi:hypothetical protein